MRQWSRRHDECQVCSKTKYKHNSHGLCSRCHSKQIASTSERKEYVREYNLINSTRIRSRMAGWRQDNPLKIKEHQEAAKKRRSNGVTLRV